MIQLRRMTQEEYDTLIPAACEAYLGELECMEAEIQRHMHMPARELGREQLAPLISEGIQTPGQSFWVPIQPSSKEIMGHLWLMEKPEENTLFIVDIFIQPAFRRRGAATIVLREVEGLAREVFHCGHIGLHVFKHNRGAIQLYKRQGFRVMKEDFSGYAMEKALKLAD
jgi:ribosomal protein S18 acetylase RimI-like enzyme